MRWHRDSNPPARSTSWATLLPVDDLARAGLWLDLTVAALTTALVGRRYGRQPAVRYLAGFASSTASAQLFRWAMTRRIGPERASLADALTLSRATCGAVLAGLVSSGVRDRAGPAGRLGWLATLTGATVTDWLDGPLARQAGPTQIGKALDIEADSWLTLWSAAGAVAWTGLPRWCLLPPLLRYIQPLLAFRGGGVPAGGGPWWSRATGVAQMALIVAALSPFHSRLRARLLPQVVLPIGAAQGLTVVALCCQAGRRRDRSLPTSSQSNTCPPLRE